MRRRVFLPVVVTSVLIVSLLYLWYNSGQHKLQRCVKAQRDHFYSTSEGQELHRHGTDPPEDLFILECNQLGIH
jgi:phosphoribosyl-AMP cyclohydrolase